MGAGRSSPARVRSVADGRPDGRDPRRPAPPRSLRLDAGWLAIINLFLIGIWLAADGSYFWPVWPILGSALGVGIKALRWPALARERLLGEAPQDLAH